MKVGDMVSFSSFEQTICYGLVVIKESDGKGFKVWWFVDNEITCREVEGKNGIRVVSRC